MWGGLECTINRVGDYWSDQDRYTHHSERGVEDLRLFETLGISMIRYPVLWETVAPDSPADPDFTSTDERMAFLEHSAMEPIVGLLHHGSGPHYTSLVDPEFPDKLAAYAGRVAERYPWVRHYTPVNEPVTTARFSGLYGAWYPHGRDDATFVRALYGEVRGTVAAMAAIRRVNPDAKLVQTDDLGRATGSPSTASRVRFENERRWLGFDLLCGLVTPDHALYGYLTGPGGLDPSELEWLERNPCPPDVIGVNHYLLSNRFLDERIDLYPEEVIARSMLESDVDYADVPALESARAEPPTLEEILSEVRDRYDIPFAVTEVHLDGDPATQVRWLGEVWSTAERLAGAGAPLRAVTAWSLIGTTDWNTLCTTPPGGTVYYEPGVFDASTGAPQETELSRMVRSLATTGTFQHPALERKGWWHDDSRLRYALEVNQEIAS
jgi:dTDP-4-dehydrorhamnose reductase